MLGFSAHRAGICTVAAVGEVISSRTARTFLSFLKVIAWVLLINSLATLVYPELLRPYVARSLSLAAIAGGFLFGVGAAVNGGCSFSTISKLAQGQLHVGMTLPAFVIGALAARGLYAGSIAIPSFEIAMPFALDSFELPGYLLAALLIWALFELGRLITSASRDGLLQAITSKRYRLSSSAALIGICAGLLYLLQGRWAYSARLLEQLSDSSAPPYFGSDAFLLFIALIAGAVVSAIGNRSFGFNFAGDKWLRNLSGGLLMGFGAFLVPGGNGKLLLQDLPHLALDAGVAYLALIAGIALTLFIQMRVFNQAEIVTCANDECVIRKD